MAVESRTVPLTREDVYQWLQGYDGQIRKTQKMRTFLEGKLKEKGLDKQRVDTRAHDNRLDDTELVDLILDDIESYG